MTPKLEIVDVSKGYVKAGAGGATTALAGINLAIETGEFVSIVGPSGCGKTTLLRIVAGLLRQSSGRVFLDGGAVVGPGPNRAFVFQSGALWPWRTVLGNIAFGLEVQGVSRHETRQRAEAVLETVGLAGFGAHYPHELSGGMRQRVNLARALVLDPDVLLMDEPFASLDAQTRELMQEELVKIWAGTGKTVLFVTHEINEAVYLSDRVIILSSQPGRIKEDVAIPLPRPRSLRAKHEVEFRKYADHIWDQISDEVRATLRRGGSAS